MPVLDTWFDVRYWDKVLPKVRHIAFSELDVKALVLPYSICRVGVLCAQFLIHFNQFFFF